MLWRERTGCKLEATRRLDVQDTWLVEASRRPYVHGQVRHHARTARVDYKHNVYWLHISKVHLVHFLDVIGDKGV